jgi:hypothetical protein
MAAEVWRESGSDARSVRILRLSAKRLLCAMQSKLSQLVREATTSEEATVERREENVDILEFSKSGDPKWCLCVVL